MKITNEQLKQIIKEELSAIQEMHPAIQDDPQDPVHELKQSIQPGTAQMLLRLLNPANPQALPEMIAMLTTIANEPGTV